MFMKRKTIDLITMIAMFCCLLYTALTGLIMEVLQVPMIIFHGQAGFIATILSIFHLVRKRDRLRTYFE
jgi:hypothetical protein